MFDQKKIDAVVEFLRQQLDPVFIYFADHTYTENIFDVAYYSEVVTDEYTTCLLENKLSEMLGVEVELNNLRECDMQFAGEIISDGDVVYCKSDLEKSRFLNSIAREFESMRINRAMLINRIKECESIYEQ